MIPGMVRVFEAEEVKGMIDEALRITAELGPKAELEAEVFRNAVSLVSMHRAAAAPAALGPSGLVLGDLRPRH